MNESKTLHRKLFSYSAMASALISAKLTHAQIIYHDVIPDLVITNDSFALDLNGDGIVDFKIHVRTHIAGTSGYFNRVGLYATENLVAGYTSGNFRYINKLAGGYVINAGDHWVGADPYASFAFEYGTGFNGGQWTGVTDGYCGLQFIKDSKHYFGWLRLNVNSTVDTITIKDYAYNAVADSGIYAGDDGILGIAHESLPSLNVLVNHDHLYLMNILESAKLSIINTAGMIVYSGDAKRGMNDINVSSLARGIYLVNLSSDKNSLVAKVALQ